MTQHGTSVYFHSDVTKKSVLKMLECLREAASCAVKNGYDSVYLYIHSEGGSM